MELHQLQITYQANQDRLLFQASFKADDGNLQEVRAWLTRRMVKRIWPAIIGAFETQVTLDKPEAAHASTDIVGIEHQAWVKEIRDSGSFNNPYQPAKSYPLGEIPILVAAIDFTQHPNQPIRMRLKPEQGDGFEVAFTPAVLHGFCSLLKDTVAKARWDMVLAMPYAAAPALEARVLN